MAYLVLSVSQLIFVLEMRNHKGLFSGGITKFMLVSFIVSLAMVCVVAFVAPLQNIFGLASLPWKFYLIALALSALPTVFHELSRFARRNLSQIVQKSSKIKAKSGD